MSNEPIEFFKGQEVLVKAIIERDGPDSDGDLRISIIDKDGASNRNMVYAALSEIIPVEQPKPIDHDAIQVGDAVTVRGEIVKFKVGDKVRWHDNTGEWHGGVILRLNPVGFWTIKSEDGEYDVHESLVRLDTPVDDASGPPSGTLTIDGPDVATIHTTLVHPNKYARTIYPLQGEPVQIDVYRVLDAYRVTDQATAHAIKKLLMPGERGSKGVVQGLEEAAFSIKQAIELLKQKGGG